MCEMERIYLVSHEILDPFLKVKKTQKQTVEPSYLPKNELNISKIIFWFIWSCILTGYETILFHQYKNQKGIS